MVTTLPPWATRERRHDAELDEDANDKPGAQDQEREVKPGIHPRTRDPDNPRTVLSARREACPGSNGGEPQADPPSASTKPRCQGSAGERPSAQHTIVSNTQRRRSREFRGHLKTSSKGGSADGQPDIRSSGMSPACGRVRAMAPHAEQRNASAALTT